MAATSTTVNAATRTQLKLTLAQQVNASPQQVFEAWLDPQLLSKWIGPRSFVESVETVLLEPRVGGRYHLSTRMKQGPAGACSSGGVRGVYRQIDRFTRLSFTWARDSDEAETLVTVQFEPAGSGTLVTLTHDGFATEEARDQHAAGWGGSLPQLADLLELRLTLKQQVNASPQRVFDALLDPNLVCRWMGPRTMVRACEVMTLEPRLGGRYRLKMDLRADLPNRPGPLFVTGAYTEIDRPNRLVYSWMWEDQGHESRVTFQLKPHAGGTEVTLIHEGFESVERQQGHSHGWTASLQQLAEVVGAA